jgi:hypothetical protein
MFIQLILKHLRKIGERIHSEIFEFSQVLLYFIDLSIDHLEEAIYRFNLYLDWKIKQLHSYLAWKLNRLQFWCALYKVVWKWRVIWWYGKLKKNYKKHEAKLNIAVLVIGIVI